MRNFAPLTTLLAVFILAGCSPKDPSGLVSDVNGYLCQACQHKFYTPSTEYARHCPKCQSPNLSEAIALVCKDGHLNVAARGLDRLPCGKCGKVANQIALPAEADLTSWGAVKAGPEVAKK